MSTLYSSYMFDSTFFKLSATLQIIGASLQIVLLIVLLILFKNHSKEISFQLKLFSSSIVILETLRIIIFLLITSNTFFPRVSMINRTGCTWSVRSGESIQIVILCSLNGLFLTSYYKSFKLKGNISLISALIVTFAAILVMEVQNTFPYHIVYASDDANIKRCAAPWDSESGSIIVSTKYAVQCFLDFVYLISMYRKRSIININNKILYSAALLLISHLIVAVTPFIIPVSVSVIFQSTFILSLCCYGVNDTTVNHVLIVSLNQARIQHTNPTTTVFKTDINNKYIHSCIIIYDTLRHTLSSRNIYYSDYLVKLIAEYASTMYSYCINCDGKLGIIECYHDYKLMNCGVVALLDENDKVLYYVNCEPTSWSDCRREETFDTEMELLCVKCSLKWKCSICLNQKLSHNCWEICACLMCKTTICAECSIYEEDDRICKNCTDYGDPNKWNFDKFDFE